MIGLLRGWCVGPRIFCTSTGDGWLCLLLEPPPPPPPPPRRRRRGGQLILMLISVIIISSSSSRNHKSSSVMISFDLNNFCFAWICKETQKPVTAMRGSSFFFSSSSFFFFNLKLHTFSGPFKKQICSVPYKEPASIFPKYKISSSKPTRIEWKKFSVHQSFPKKYTSPAFFSGRSPNMQHALKQGEYHHFWRLPPNFVISKKISPKKNGGN